MNAESTRPCSHCLAFNSHGLAVLAALSTEAIAADQLVVGTFSTPGEDGTAASPNGKKRWHGRERLGGHDVVNRSYNGASAGGGVGGTGGKGLTTNDTPGAGGKGGNADATSSAANGVGDQFASATASGGQGGISGQATSDGRGASGGDGGNATATASASSESNFCSGRRVRLGR